MLTSKWKIIIIIVKFQNYQRELEICYLKDFDEPFLWPKKILIINFHVNFTLSFLFLLEPDGVGGADNVSVFNESTLRGFEVLSFDAV